MDRPDSIQTLLALRKLTRAIADALRAQMMEHLATVTPLLRAKPVFGDYLQGGAKEPARRADKAFKDLQALYETIATAKPFNLARELKPPIDVPSLSLEVTPIEYTHVARVGDESRSITLRRPLNWALTYGGFAPSRLKELLASRARPGDDLQQIVLGYLAMHVVVTHQTGLMQMLEMLRFPVSTIKMPEFGDLPVTCIGSAITTSRASDELILQSAELTGMDAFEEVINLADVAALRDPQKEQLLALVQGHAPEIAPQA
jgi:hypothetical protein